MSTSLAERESPNLRPGHRWTVAEYHRMREVGLLNENSRVELVDGEIVEMAPIGGQHGGKVNRFIHVFYKALGNQAIIAAQNPVVLGGYGEPQPDIAILRWREDYYEQAHPYVEREGLADHLPLVRAERPRAKSGGGCLADGKKSPAKTLL